MAAYENDSEAYWWAFDIFGPFPNPPYYGSGADQETTFYTNYCVREVTEVGQQGTDETGPSSLCSSSGGYSCRREFSPKISDEYSVVDGKVGGRLNQMHPIPHVPRINGDIPSFDEATSDHQRLLERLQLYDLVEHKVQGDGNCQYGVKIFVITSFKDTCYIEILPDIAKSKRVIFLSFWAEVHYNSIYLEEKDLPTADTKRKKRWWQLGNRH